MNPRVNEVKYKHPYKLILTFNNGELKEFDFVNYLNYPVYEKLKNPVFCSTVKVFLGTAVLCTLKVNLFWSLQNNSF
jgi:hypothetical protein